MHAWSVRPTQFTLEFVSSLLAVKKNLKFKDVSIDCDFEEQKKLVIINKYAGEINMFWTVHWFFWDHTFCSIQGHFTAFQFHPANIDLYLIYFQLGRIKPWIFTYLLTNILWTIWFCISLMTHKLWENKLIVCILYFEFPLF